MNRYSERLLKICQCLSERTCRTRFCFIDPIRNASNTNVLLYNSTSKEITYDTAVSSANTVLVSNDVADTTCFIPFVNNTPAGSYQSVKAQSALTYNASTSQLGVS